MGKQKHNSKKVATVPGAQKVNTHHFPAQVPVKYVADSNKERTSAGAGRKCGECSIGDTDKCPSPMHTKDSHACDLFVSNSILTEEMKKNFPKYGDASTISYGEEKQSQFQRSKRESTKKYQR